MENEGFNSRRLGMKKPPKSAFMLFFVLLSLGWGETQKEAARESNQAVLMELGSMVLVNWVGDMSVVSLGYERKIPNTPYSFQIHVHGGYDASGESGGYGDTSWAAGGGLTLRRYFGAAFDGAFGQTQCDYVRGEQINMGYSQFDGMTWTLGDRTVDRKSYLVPQLSFGYKWQNESFLFEGSVGGAVYLTPSEKFTSLSVSLNVGAPF
jgi:hypothetical protein